MGSGSFGSCCLHLGAPSAVAGLVRGLTCWISAGRLSSRPAASRHVFVRLGARAPCLMSDLPKGRPLPKREWATVVCFVAAFRHEPHCRSCRAAFGMAAGWKSSQNLSNHSVKNMLFLFIFLCWFYRDSSLLQRGLNQMEIHQTRWNRVSDSSASEGQSQSCRAIRLGPPVVPLYPFFGEGSPTK